MRDGNESSADIRDHVRNLNNSARSLDRRGRDALVGILEFFSESCRRLRDDIVLLGPATSDTHALQGAAQGLEEILGETARAADAIFTAAEEIEAISRGTSPEIAKQLQAAATRIYEACAFQDITGQRITKVMGTLQQLETGIAEFTRACGGAFPAGASAKPVSAATGDEALLNGPAIGHQAPSQADIDRLFNEV